VQCVPGDVGAALDLIPRLALVLVMQALIAVRLHTRHAAEEEAARPRRIPHAAVAVVLRAVCSSYPHDEYSVW
jgi:hypothetical protein